MLTYRNLAHCLLLCVVSKSIHAWVQLPTSPVQLATTDVFSKLQERQSRLTLSLQLQTGGLTISPNTLQPAHEHAASWFGKPDPYLAAAKSIAPSAKALESMAVGGVAPTSAPGVLPEALQKVVSQGWHLLDARLIHQEEVLPGFSPQVGILPVHQLPPETPASFAATVDWSARYLDVVDKLPVAALAYVMVEFFILRPNIDLYKEEIRQEPGAVALETAVTTGVRVLALAIVGTLTLSIFG